MMDNSILEAKEVLDRLISKQRVALYKPIQVAEILYRVRLHELSIDDIRDDLEAYRNSSRHWRDSVTRLLIDRVSTSSQRYQDNLFDPNAMPPETLAILAEENNRHQGIVERYIYLCFWERQKRILHLGDILNEATVSKFHLDNFLAQFVREKGIKRSIDKAYEIVVYALFNTLVKHLKIKVTLSADPAQSDLLREFEEFARLVLGISAQNPSISLEAKLYRAGATNAADRGLDMWANFGPVIQVKHLTLTDKLVDDVCDEVDSDHIVIICKNGEKETIQRLLQQLGHRVQAIITQSQLIQWYEQALHGAFASRLGSDLLKYLRQEFRNEFPYSATFEPFYRERGYDCIPKSVSPFWKVD